MHKLRMKGEAPGMLAGGAAVVLGILAIFAILELNYINIATAEKVGREKMDAIDLTHWVRECLSENGIVKDTLITEHKIEGCSIPDSCICIKDLENGEGCKWEFRRGGSEKHEYAIYIPLLIGDEIRVGGLHVKI